MNPIIWTSIVSVLFLAVILNWAPLWRRHNLWFGVTVPSGFPAGPEAHAVLLRYRIEIWLLALVCALTDIVAAARSEWLMMSGVLVLMAGSIVAFALAHNRMLKFAVPAPDVRSASITPSTEGLPGTPAAALVPFALLTAAAIYLWVNWLRIPERFPVHWDSRGQPNRWAERNWPDVFGPLLVGALIAGILLLVGEAILRRSPRSRVAASSLWTSQYRRTILRLIVVLSFCVSLLLAWVAILPLLRSGSPLVSFLWLAPLLMFSALAPLVWKLIGMSRSQTRSSDGTPDAAWKLGQFYYNPDDPALMIEKRFGIGYTFNFANPASWCIIALTLAATAVILILVV